MAPLLAHGQRWSEEDRFAITAGVEVKWLQDFGLLNMDSVVLRDPNQNFRSVYQLVDGMGFGGVIRVRLSRIWNLETGLYYNRRVYRFAIQDIQPPDVQNVFRDETRFRVVGYEIPIKGLVYIQLSDDVFMNVDMGVSMNFVASDVISLHRNYNVKGFKPAWLRVGVI